jgi:chemotaxis protein histidine kinase CheA
MVSGIEGIDSDELLKMYLDEFTQLIEVFQSSLKAIEKQEADLSEDYHNIFRVFHNLKGSSVYFEDQKPLIDFTKEACEYFRHLPESEFQNEDLISWTKEALEQLVIAKIALERGKQLKSEYFKPPPESLKHLLSYNK